MGVPYHTSRDVPGRCLWLIEQLYHKVRSIPSPDAPDLGPLDATFLFAMSSLILTLPIERLERHRRKEEQGLQGYMDDRPLDKASAEEVDAILGSDAVLYKASPFFVPNTWRFASIQHTPGQNLAVDFPAELAHALAAEEAVAATNEMSARQWTSCLRNALAHGGIIYLNEQGQQAQGEPATMMGFASALYPDGNMRKPPERIIALRTTPEGYRASLIRWVQWVQRTGLSQALAA
jgi:hypothetical protein